MNTQHLGQLNQCSKSVQTVRKSSTHLWLTLRPNPNPWTFSRSSASLRGSSSHPHRSITGFRVINDFPLFSATLVNMLKPLASQYARCEQHHRRKLLEKRSTSTFGAICLPLLAWADVVTISYLLTSTRYEARSTSHERRGLSGLQVSHGLGANAAQGPRFFLTPVIPQPGASIFAT